MDEIKKRNSSFCSQCGEEVSNDMRFCSKCGTEIALLAPSSKNKIIVNTQKVQDLLGFVSAGVILIILTMTFIRHPVDPSIIVTYIRSMAAQKVFFKPPMRLLNSAVFFFYALGIWIIVLSGLRIIFQRNVRKAFSDLLGGFFSFFLVFLLSNYASDFFTGKIVLAFFLIAIGLLIVGTAIFHFAFPKRQRN